MFPAFCLLKILLPHKRNLFFLSESAHTFSFDILLSFAMLLLQTASAPLQCLAAQKIWKCLDKHHPLSMRISSTESLQTCFINLLKSSSTISLKALSSLCCAFNCNWNAFLDKRFMFMIAQSHSRAANPKPIELTLFTLFIDSLNMNSGLCFCMRVWITLQPYKTYTSILFLKSVELHQKILH